MNATRDALGHRYQDEYARQVSDRAASAAFEVTVTASAVAAGVFAFVPGELHAALVLLLVMLVGVCLKVAFTMGLSGATIPLAEKPPIWQLLIVGLAFCGFSIGAWLQIGAENHDSFLRGMLQGALATIPAVIAVAWLMRRALRSQEREDT